MTRVTRILDELVEAVPAAVRRAGVAPNSCILSSRLGVAALREQGVRARAIAVDLKVMNEVYAQALEERGAGVDVDADTLVERGAWVIAGGTGKAGGFDGHVVVVAQERYLVDLSAAQFDRPERAIKAEAFWAEARELARGAPWAGRSEDGAVWLYEPRVGDRAFVRAPAWSAYRIEVRGNSVVSVRTPGRADVPVAAEVVVDVTTRGR